MKSTLLLAPVLALFCFGYTKSTSNLVHLTPLRGTSNLAAATLPPTSPITAVSTEFEIKSPSSNSVVDKDVIEVRGVGAISGAKITVSVFTNDWYEQRGTAEISADGHWTYAPVYLKGEGQYNNHTIKAQMTVKGTSQFAEVKNVRRR